MAHHEHPNVTLVKEGSDAFQRGDMAWMGEHIADDVVWHVGGNSKWAGEYKGKDAVLGNFARQTQAMGAPPEVDIHDTLGNDDHVVQIGTARAKGPDGSTVEWKFSQIFHVKDGVVTEVWGMAENDAAVDPFLDALPG
jgi:ketosteroid isomerase-like protein